MSSLIHRESIGDVRFGASQDIVLNNVPWEYYSILGVPRTASRQEIDRAYKRLARKHHSDRTGGDGRQFRTLDHVAKILLDDGGDLGPEHSRRRHYDFVCSLESEFDGVLEGGGERTTRFSEVMLRNLDLERKAAQEEIVVLREFPKFTELKERLKSPVSQYEAERIIDEMRDLVGKARELSPEAISALRESRHQEQARQQDLQRQFFDTFKFSPGSYFSKILDVFYIGDRGVTFGSDRNRLVLNLAGHKDTKHILELVLGGECYISGFSRVHFKAPHGNVAIQDPSVNGIVHVINGNVEVRYSSSAYGVVIRAKAPNVRIAQGFVQKDDLYVPEDFASGNWWERKPTLDIKVQHGTITLQSIRSDFTDKIFIPSNDTYSKEENSLEGLLSNYLIKDNHKNIIKKKKYY